MTSESTGIIETIADKLQVESNHDVAHHEGRNAPAPDRTRFAVGLQLGRMYPSLLGLLRAQWEGRESDVRLNTRRIAHAILDGARDRSRERHPSPRIDQQDREASLDAPRIRARRTSSVVTAKTKPKTRAKAKTKRTARKTKRNGRKAPPRILQPPSKLYGRSGLSA